ncbi:hypothetical protein JG687_00005399 [Phytophthora cactorum]|uniref:HTH CENPB-type domain-containing protein n=1 Tax=Phytophthora cactorum TaxID=29920 RepID=A0A8T1UQP1_9STRA|nr:hypothetical protein PC121_g11967 [Phytophthora cactorum]KAG6965529.1 hypothetical protein JG687_00005399 [Phytophthora cactorum]
MPSTLDKYYSHLNASKRESQRKRIYAWEKEMAASASTAVLKSDRKKGTATTISTEGEEGLVEWVNSLRGEGVLVSRLMLQLQAKDIAQEEGLTSNLSKQLRDYAAGGTDSKFELKAPSRREAIEWATMAWKALGRKVIKSGFTYKEKKDSNTQPETIVAEELEHLEAIEENPTTSSLSS